MVKSSAIVPANRPILQRLLAAMLAFLNLLAFKAGFDHLDVPVDPELKRNPTTKLVETRANGG